MLRFEKTTETNYQCTLNLDKLYEDQKLINKFNKRWEEFLDSDENNRLVLKRTRNIITYTHKSWMPINSNKRMSVLILAGNPAPHSVINDVYYSYEGNGREHRFWKVLRELGYVDLNGLDKDIKDKFINLKYRSPFRLAFETIFTFPSAPSTPKWSGVMGLSRLFGQKYLNRIYEIEKIRVRDTISNFIREDGSIIAMQKDAYNSIADNKYDIKLAVTGNLQSYYNHIRIFGTPPTRWLYTQKMKKLLLDIKTKIILSKS